MKSAFETFVADLYAPVQRDPAAHGIVDVILSYPGFHAITLHRAIHALNKTRVPILPRFLAHLARFATGIEIHPGATIGKGIFIDHGMGVVIGETTEIGENVTLNQGVTLGGTSRERVKRHPTLGDNVIVGADALVIGAITVGEGARVGAGSVVVKDVPPYSTVVGIPARIVSQNGKPVAESRLDRGPTLEMLDPNAALIAQLVGRVAALEARLHEEDDASRYLDDAYPVI